jgi:hypothetical protein
MSNQSEELEYAVELIERAVGLIANSDAFMRQYKPTNPHVRVVISPIFQNAVDFIDRHHAHMAQVKAALAKVSAS